MYTDTPFADLNSAVTACQSKVEQTVVNIAADRDKALSDLTTAQGTIVQLASRIRYPDLEYNAWSQNSNPSVGGTGLGKAFQTRPGSDGWATFRNEPDAPIAPATNNEFDTYFTKTFAPDPTKKQYRLNTDWMFPTLFDANSARCLEMEARHILQGGLMFVIACQLNFASKLLRVYEFPAGSDKGHWISIGAPLLRFTPGKPYRVLLEGHRDDTLVFTDQITINDVVTKVGTSYPAFNKGWGPFIKCSLQLDSDFKSGAYTANLRNTDYEVA